MYHEQWERNQRVKAAVKSSKTELELLRKVNDKHMLFPCATGDKTSAPNEDTDDFSNVGTSGHVDGGEDASGQVGDGEDTSAESEVTRRAGWVNIADAAPMPQPNHLSVAIRPREQLGPPIVGGLLIGLTDENLPRVRQIRKRGHRGKDVSSRRKRMRKV
jgi:hypothetical protein